MPPCTAPQDLTAAFLSPVFAAIEAAILSSAITAVNGGNQVDRSSAVPRRARVRGQWLAALDLTLRGIVRATTGLVIRTIA
jgi:hypothetical protein